MSSNHEGFHYTYSANQQEEVKRIREKYLPPAEDKLEQLRRLDRSAARKGQIAALATGILSALILGVGMCCAMVWSLILPGVAIGAVGIAGVCAAYPLYTRITRRERERLSPAILRLSEELMQ